jgi:SAM-dependent methyltransferase
MKPEDPHFLKHLAELGATDLHPLGRRATVQLVSALDIDPGHRILDVGCGTGGTLIWLSQSKTGYACGVDVLPEMVRVARRRVLRTGMSTRVGLALADAAALPFASGAFDRVYTESVLGFQDALEAEALLAEVFRVLTPGGRFVANEAIWKATTSPRLAADVHAACSADFGLAQASQQAWSLTDWLALMAGTGFETVSHQLLDELPANAEPGGVVAVPAAVRESDRLTRALSLGRLLNPRLALQSWRYRRRVARHREHGRLIESRLFVLVKPDERARQPT